MLSIFPLSKAKNWRVTYSLSVLLALLALCSYPSFASPPPSTPTHQGDDSPESDTLEPNASDRGG